MKNLAISIFLVAISVSGPCAAADASLPAGRPAQVMNPFEGPLTINGERKPAPPNEDLSNPLVEAHYIEQYLYLNRYYTHYNVKPQNPDAPRPGEPTSAVDIGGRPLWFDWPSGNKALKDLLGDLLNNGQFDDVERVFDDWSKSSELMADGTPKLIAFETEFSTTFDSGDWEGIYRTIKDWRKSRPTSRVAALAEVIYWERYAWAARGSGFGYTVSEDGWKLFHERLEKAEAVLADCKPYASTSPLWAVEEIEVELGLNRPKEVLLSKFRESVIRFPYFVPLYTAMARALSPAWDGDWKLVDDFIRDAVKNTSPTEGRSMYARLYWTLGTFDLFNASPANWAEMKNSFDDLVHRYPHSGWILNKYAAYACIAEDKNTFQHLRSQIGSLVIAEAWPPNPTLDLCDHKFPAQAL
jgi:hypothetical protein